MKKKNKILNSCDISVAIIDDCIVISQEKSETVKIPFKTIKQFFAFKKDLFIFDEINIGIRIDDKGTYYEVNEEADNYRLFIDYIEKKFDFPAKWYLSVTKDPFAPNHTHLWGEEYPY